ARAGGPRAIAPRGRRARPRTGTRSAASCSSYEAVEAVALGAVAGTPDIGELGPAHRPRGGGRVEFVLRAALDEHQRTGGGLHHVEWLRADAAMVVERRGLRYAERALREALGADGQLALQLQRHRAVALLVVDPRHPQHGEAAPQQHHAY